MGSQILLLMHSIVTIYNEMLIFTVLRKFIFLVLSALLYFTDINRDVFQSCHTTQGSATSLKLVHIISNNLSRLYIAS